MIWKLTIAACALLIAAPAGAGPGTAAGQPDIVVITQNQYLGADLDPIVNAQDPIAYAVAVLGALDSIAANDIPERAQALAATIAERDAHLVGLQEMFLFECIESGSLPGACAQLAPAMNDHLQLTLDALGDLGADYHVAGVVNNLDVPGTSIALPGLPVFLDLDLVPDAFVRVLDRDVILARSDVTTSVVPFPCAKPSADGCNYSIVATAPTIAGDLPIERGFVGVDAMVDGRGYRFVNTHLEVRFPAPDPLSQFFQAAQASQLVATMATPLPPGYELIVVGDINSSPEDSLATVPFVPPYQQLANGVDFIGFPAGPALIDTWPLRPGKSPGLTCCEDSDLLNPESDHRQRIDVVFSLNTPSRVKANVLNNNPEDRTPSGLWPSDHASVVMRLDY